MILFRRDLHTVSRYIPADIIFYGLDYIVSNIRTISSKYMYLKASLVFITVFSSWQGVLNLINIFVK